jgi:hypothetical protein
MVALQPLPQHEGILRANGDDQARAGAKPGQVSRRKHVETLEKGRHRGVYIPFSKTKYS